MVYKKCEDVMVCSFGANPVWPVLSRNNSIITNLDKIARYREGFRGHSTKAWKIFRYLRDENIKVDRVVVLSDMQCYGDFSVAGELSVYRRKVNQECFVHFFDLQGYGAAQAPPDELTNTVSGFSEKIMNQILTFEGAESTDGSRPIPSLEYVREHY
jgi:hypothetical protein